MHGDCRVYVQYIYIYIYIHTYIHVNVYITKGGQDRHRLIPAVIAARTPSSSGFCRCFRAMATQAAATPAAARGAAVDAWEAASQAWGGCERSPGLARPGTDRALY